MAYQASKRDWIRGLNIVSPPSPCFSSLLLSAMSASPSQPDFSKQRKGGDPRELQAYNQKGTESSFLTSSTQDNPRKTSDIAAQPGLCFTQIAVAAVWRANWIQAKMEAPLDPIGQFLNGILSFLAFCDTKTLQVSLRVVNRPFKFISVVSTNHLLGSSLTTNTGDNNPESCSSDPEAGTQVEYFCD